MPYVKCEWKSSSTCAGNCIDPRFECGQEFGEDGTKYCMCIRKSLKKRSPIFQVKLAYIPTVVKHFRFYEEKATSFI